MGDPTIRHFEITSKTSDCVQAPVDPKQDKCQILVTSGLPDKQDSFTLERKGRDYLVASGSQALVNKVNPNFKAPTQNLNDYLLARGEFFRAFGDVYEPTEYGKSINLTSEGKSPMEIVVDFTNFLSAFIGMGEIDSTNPVKKFQLLAALQAATFAYADSKMGPKINEVLGQLEKSSSLSAGAKERVSFLIAAQESWDKLWNHLQPVVDKVSPDLAKDLKASAAILIWFLLADHLLEQHGAKGFMQDKVYEAGRKFFDEMSRLDVEAKFGDYYEFMRKGLQQIKTPKLSSQEQNEFNRRLTLIDTTFAQAAKNKIAYLGNQSAPKAVKESLRMKYNSNPVRSKALESILKNLEVKDVGGRPNFEINISKISQEWRTMAGGPLDKGYRKELILAMNYLLKQLFERNGKMSVFWKNDFQQMDNFYDTVKRSLLSEDSKTLDDLVKWMLSEADQYDIELPTSSEPHPPLRKWTLLAEGGGALLGTGAALGFHYGAKDKDPMLQYHGTGGSIIFGGSALGAATGNLLSYGLKVKPKYAWIFDVGGAVLGGVLAGGLYYGLTSPPGMGQPPGQDPGTRFPVDPYGP